MPTTPGSYIARAQQLLSYIVAPNVMQQMQIFPVALQTRNRPGEWFTQADYVRVALLMRGIPVLICSNELLYIPVDIMVYMTGARLMLSGISSRWKYCLSTSNNHILHSYCLKRACSNSLGISN